MRLKMMLPPVQPDQYIEPTQCVRVGCAGTRFHLRQTCRKAVRDTVVREVTARRYACVRCGQTFRVYPVGIRQDQISTRLKGISILLYLLGLSYGAVSDALTALGWTFSKTAVYNAVQAAGERVPDLRRAAVSIPSTGTPLTALGMDVTSVKCAGQWLTLGVGVDAISGVTVTIDLLDNAQAPTLTAWVQQVVTATGAQILVSDDADSFKQAAAAAGVQQQVCKAHVLRNTEARTAELTHAMQSDADGSLAALGRTPTEAAADVARVLDLTRRRQPADHDQLAQMHQRYVAAPPPKKETKASVAYRMRLLTLDRWNLWSRLTLYRTWSDAHQRTLDGTNNATERTIGWDVKERYRSMRGYKRAQSVLNVSRLIAWTRNEGKERRAPRVRLVA